MKSVWKSAWALGRRPHVLSPLLNAASVPGTRRARSAPSKSSSPRLPPSEYSEQKTQPDKRPTVPGYLKLQGLRSDLEQQAQIQDQSQDGPSGASASRPSYSRSRASGEAASQDRKRYGLFKRVVSSSFENLLQNHDLIKELKPLGINSKNELAKEAHLFRNIIEKAFDLAARSAATGRQQNPYFWSWRNAFISGDQKALTTELQYSFVSFIVRQHLSKDAIECHERLADMRFPHEWYPATRTMQRTIHLHVGPTNSGKTYNALKALEEAKTGIYAGPLRLLAHETYSRFKAKGKRCALVTGEEQRIPEGDESFFSACTVEMTPLNQRVDVAIIDEIQMMGDEHRGWAWTQAVLGVQAKEVHLCGEERAVPLVQALCAKMGDEVVVHNYKRLSCLQPMQESLRGSFENLRKGDAIVSFSRVNLHSLKAGIEQATGKKCAIVYGGLPPDVRAQQAALFNDPDNDYDFLAASDAIGMGLNLEIKRVVFETITKHDGTKLRVLTIPELKQIGGRAGRFKTAAQANRDAAAFNPGTPKALSSKEKESVGFVTTLEEEDLDTIHGSFDKVAEPLQSAGLFPPSSILEKFASYFPAGTPFTFMLLRLRDIARLPGRFHMCDFSGALDIAALIQKYPMTMHDRCIFMNAPVSLRDHNAPAIVRALAKRIGNSSSGDLLEITEIPLEILEFTEVNYPMGMESYLKHLESLHKSLVLYLWLSYRYVGIFRSQSLAFHVKEQVEEKINTYLASLSYSASARQARITSQRRAARKLEKRSSQFLGDDEKENQMSATPSPPSPEPRLNEYSDGDNASPPRLARL